MKNSRKHPNSIGVAPFAKWVAVGLILAIAGLGYVRLQNQLITYGDIKRTHEESLKRLKKENYTLVAQVEQLTTRIALEEFISTNQIALVDIPNDRSIDLMPGPIRQEGIRAVSNSEAEP